ncbi:MAG: CubicO group peptidase (beta-lactamase class C family) [Saprospiraceae bacterium]|jgi:CubicO group peptidase (beta-lactamase class C family)
MNWGAQLIFSSQICIINYEQHEVVILKIKTMQKIILLLTFFSSFSLNAQMPTLEFEVGGKKMGLEERLKIAKVNGTSTIIIRDGEVFATEQYGYADIENKIPVTENTIFQAGTLTLPLTAFAVLRTVESGKLDLDKDVNEYLKTWKLPVNRFNKKKPVTTRALLLKQVRFNSDSKPKGYASNETMPTFLQILNGEAPAKNKKVGVYKKHNKKGNYSFFGEIIMQKMLEDIYQKPFQNIMQELVLTPLNMTESFIAAELPADKKALTATGYMKDGSSISGGQYRHPELAASGLWTTPRDYAKFMFEIMTAYDEKSDLLSQKMTRAALKVQDDNSPKCLLMNASNGNDMINYGAASTGFRTQFHGSAEKKWAIITFMNSWENWQMMAEFNWQTINALKLRE